MQCRRLTPDAVVPEVTAIEPAALKALGIRAVVLDLDNTLTPWNVPHCPPRVRRWLGDLEAAGLRLCLVSNNGPERVRSFCAAAALQVPWIAHAGKPRQRAYLRALQHLGCTPAETAAIGDQLFTDVLGARRAGLWAILVPPLGRREFPLTQLMRIPERLWLAYLRRRGLLRPLVAVPPLWPPEPRGPGGGPVGDGGQAAPSGCGGA